MKLTPKDVCKSLQGPCHESEVHGIGICAFCYKHNDSLNIPLIAEQRIRQYTSVDKQQHGNVYMVDIDKEEQIPVDKEIVEIDGAKVEVSYTDVSYDDEYPKTIWVFVEPVEDTTND